MEKTFVYFACLHLIVSLGLAWLLVLTKYTRVPWLTKIFQSYPDLIRAHIDYLLMSLFLFVFFLFHRLFEFAYPPWVICVMLFGTTINPAGLVIRAVRPKIDVDRPPWYQILMGVSFACTTVGFLYCSLLLAVNLDTVEFSIREAVVM